MTVDEKVAILKATVGFPVTIQVPGAPNLEGTLKSYRVVDGSRMVADVNCTEGVVTMNPVLFFVRKEGVLVPLYGDGM